MYNTELTYPTQLINVTDTMNGHRITIRPFLPQDFDLQRDFFSTLSQDSRYLRFMTPAKSLSDKQLEQFAQLDHRKHVLLIASVVEDGDEKMIAEARFVESNNSENVCEFAICVSEGWRGYRIATRLLSRLERHARAMGFNRIVAETFAHNRPMTELARSAGYAMSRNTYDLSRVRLTKVLAPSGRAWRVTGANSETVAA